MDSTKIKSCLRSGLTLGEIAVLCGVSTATMSRKVKALRGPEMTLLEYRAQCAEELGEVERRILPPGNKTGRKRVFVPMDYVRKGILHSGTNLRIMSKKLGVSHMTLSTRLKEEWSSLGLKSLAEYRYYLRWKLPEGSGPVVVYKKKGTKKNG